MAEKYGWTLEYVESLPLDRIHEYVNIQDGESKGLAKLSKLK
jgi:hypothetical protein